MRTVFIVLLSITIQPIFGHASPPTIITGKILHLTNQCEVEDMSAIGRLTFPNTNHFFTTDSANNFKILIQLESPGYFRIGRNILYLSPGDSLSMELDFHNPEVAVFNGSKALENGYLRYTPFPLAGSFAAISELIKPTIEESIQSIVSFGAKREKQLSQLENVTTSFLQLEKARIRGDIVNSILDLYYEFPEVNKLTGAAKNKFENEYVEKRFDYIRPFAEYFLDTSYLQLTVYQKIAPTLLRANPTLSKTTAYIHIKDWLLAQSVFRTMNSSKQIANSDSILLVINTISSVNYKARLLQGWQMLNTLRNGEEAKRLVAEDRNGNRISLEKWKGKIILIDVWATWCGPCIAAFPKLKEVREMFKEDSSIVILTLSIDDNKDKWRKALDKYSLEAPTLLIDRAELEAYQVYSIPRTIVIDKHFNIAAFKGPTADEQLAIIDLLRQLKNSE